MRTDMATHQRLRYGRIRVVHCLCLVALAVAGETQGLAQLAITEVMAVASADAWGSDRPDFWELTNFGTEPVDLSGYKWADEDIKTWADAALLPIPAEGAEIGPGKSVIFFRSRSNVPDVAAFREWWGAEIPTDLQIYAWSSRPAGIDEEQGGVKLWDPNGNLVDEVTIRGARRGISLTYESSFGAFTNSSAIALDGAFQAAVGGDVGSPGRHLLPPVSIRFIIQPSSQTVDAGIDVVLKALATGRPQPRYQWSFNDTPVQSVAVDENEIPRMICFAGCGSTWTQIPSRSDLVLSKIQPDQAGIYRVRAFNGLDERISDPADVMVNTNPHPVEVHCPDLACPSEEGSTMAGLTVRIGQPATFTVQFSGYPAPTFAWSFSADGDHFSPIADATNQSFSVPVVSLGDQGIYRVRLSNPLGVVADAQLKVRLPAALKTTEVMSLDCTLVGRDWWEMTNVGDQPESICGYRWDDTVSPLAIGQGPTITNQVILKPGESVIFLESQSPESFRQWWGASNLPPHLQFIIYSANGLSSGGDAIYLWDPTAIDPGTYIDGVAFATATAGVSFWFDPDSPVAQVGEFSVEGDCGTFRASERCDIGSPGWTRWSPSHLVGVRREGAVTVLNWRAQPGSRHRLQFARELASGTATTWNNLDSYSFPSVTCTATDIVPAGESQRFYRLIREAPADCTYPERLE